MKFSLGYVYLNPVKPEFVSSTIRVEVQLPRAASSNSSDPKFLLNRQAISRDDLAKVLPMNKLTKNSFFIDIPIIGSVVNRTSLFSSLPDF